MSASRRWHPRSGAFAAFLYRSRWRQPARLRIRRLRAAERPPAGLPTGFTTNAALRDLHRCGLRQNIELRRAKNDRRRMECSSDSVVIIGGDDEAACAELDGTIARMERICGNSRRSRHLIGGGDDDVRRRSSLQWNSTAARGAARPGIRSAEGRVWRAPPPGKRRFTEHPEGLPPDSDAYPLLLAPRGRASAHEPDFAGSLRTMCVRTAWRLLPISRHAPADFGRDPISAARAARVRRRSSTTCARNGRSGPDGSATTGRPYTDLPTAVCLAGAVSGSPASVAAESGFRNGCQQAKDRLCRKASPPSAHPVIPSAARERRRQSNGRRATLRPDQKTRSASSVRLSFRRKRRDRPQASVGPRYQPLQDN